MKINFQVGTNVPANCVPQEQLKIARHFNAGSLHQSRQVPEGRPICGHRFSRPCGTGLISNLFPALKRRAIFKKSLWDSTLLAALVLFLAVGATAQTTNDSVEAIIQGRKLVVQLLNQRPTENSTNTGTLKIRGSKREHSEIPIKCEVLITATNWQNTYEAFFTNTTETLVVIHPNDQPFQNEGDFPDSGFIVVLKDVQRLNLYKHTYPAAGRLNRETFANSDFSVADLSLAFFSLAGTKGFEKRIPPTMCLHGLGKHESQSIPEWLFARGVVD